jgi:glycosyltransferase involved in cell wall biosynthesis
LTNPFLSIIIPAYNEEKRLPTTLDQVFAFLQTQDYQSEIIIVDNASSDQTLSLAQKFAEKHIGSHPRVRVIQEPTRGKGIAVKTGMLASKAEYRFMCDADLSMPIAQVERFLPPSLNGFDIAIASREIEGAVRYNEPFYRHFVGRVFNFLIRITALPELQDTQCGFKCFRGSVADDLFSKLTIIGWSFDVEALFIAGRKNYKIIEIPIPWYFNNNSKVKVVSDSMRMALDIFQIRWNSWHNRYDQK